MRKIFTLVITAFLLLSYNSNAQLFTPISNPFPGIGRGAVTFIDMDNNGALDLFITGQDGAFAPVAKLYRNVNGEFTEMPCPVRALYNCALSVADYDHDGFMDMIITGEDYEGPATLLYKNTGTFSFTLSENTFYTPGSDGDVAFGDYDNDGYADIIISGNWQTRLYKNNGDGTFANTNINLPALNSTSVAWGDYDNDGDLDLLLVGDDGDLSTYILTNNNGSFVKLETDIEGVVGGTAKWGDYDNDGYLDILITGKNSTLSPVSFLYRNNTQGNFVFGNAGLVGTALGCADFVDFDNDGDPDIMLAGQNAGCGNASTRLYANDGIGIFREDYNTLAFVERAASAWGDYDNDGDMDLVLIGITGSAARYLYRNDIVQGTFQPNTPPAIPVVNEAYTSEGTAVLSWQYSTDDQSPVLTYNVRVGTTPGGIDIMSPNSDLNTGSRYIAAQGNAGFLDFTVLKNLQSGTYYYSVQAIDQAYKASGFSQENSFIIVNTAVINLQANNLIANIARTGNNITVWLTNHAVGVVAIYAIDGRLLDTESIKGNIVTFKDTGSQSKLYLIKAVTNQGTYTCKVLL